MERLNWEIADPAATDAELAAELARRLGMEMPDVCAPGVAANLRLLQRRLDVFRGDPR